MARRHRIRVLALHEMLEWQRADVRETGGNNRGKAVEKIIRTAGGTPGEPWCGDAVAAAYLRAGANPRRVTRAWAYVPALSRVLARVRSPRPGHIVIYDFQRDGTADHTGLFLRWVNRRAGTFEAVEGNTRPGTATSDAGGGEGVHIRQRSTTQVAGWRRYVGYQWVKR